MLRLILIGLFTLAGCILLRRFLILLRRAGPLTKQQKKRMLALGLFGILMVLVISGKAHWLMAVAAAGFGALRSLLPLLIRHWPHLSALYGLSKRRNGQTHSHQHQHQHQQQHQQQKNQPPPSGHQMSKHEACTILGVPEDASRAVILAAYKRLMQRCHPDRGGSDYLATQLNTAKKVLLG